MTVKENVLERYSAGARAREESLCCPVDYDRDLLKMLPAEIIERDYGCGDPSRYVQPGDRVLDLGSGGGKICYMAAQLVGSDGHVIGVDMNDDMLDLARRHQATMAERLGGERVDFRKGYIQDLALDLAAAEAWLAENPVNDIAGMRAYQSWCDAQRRERPLVGDASVDLVISNCVLNLVEEADRHQLLAEVFRVLRPGGRVAISDIVANRSVPAELRRDPELWTGCISGAFHESAFLQAFADAGFVGLAYDKWQEEPWQVVEGIEFRSVTLTGCKPASVAAHPAGGEVIYRGPFHSVTDDDGNVFRRGERVEVGGATLAALRSGPWAGDFVFIGAESASRGCCPAPTPGAGVERTDRVPAGGCC